MANPDHAKAFRTADRDRNSTISLSGFDLRKMRASCPRLNQVDLSRADLSGSDLGGGHFQGADLRDADLSRVKISLGDFRNAKMSNANLTGADLNASVMSGADLSNANLTKACFVKTRMDGVKLDGANLDRTDLRGAQGITAEQLAAAKNSDRAVLDERMLASLGKTGKAEVARHGLPKRKEKPPNTVDFIFEKETPCFGDVFQLCGFAHPEFPPTGDFGFSELQDLGIEQTDDFFAMCADGDPVVWIFPLVKGEPVHHHPGPFDGIRIQADSAGSKAQWSKCASRFEAALKIPFKKK